ncbi:hypothetical protein FRC09_003009 [Ceratobasidium sp. 395]|nr:hypothetical protein FRC09_003009 [Ceratobasidium sp. 395]
MSSQFRCDYCRVRFGDDKALSNHMAGSGRCGSALHGSLATVYSTDEGESDHEQDEEDDNIPNDEEHSGSNQSDAPNLSDQDEDEDMRSRASSDRMSVDERSDSNDSLNRDWSNQGHEEVPARLRGTETFVEHYPEPTVGEPIRQATPEELAERQKSHEEVGPFADEDLFDLVELLMTSGMSGKKRDEFLKLNRFNGGTPWSSNREMLIDIDKFLPRGPKWRVKTFEIVGSKGTEYVEFWYRDLLEAILQLLADPQFREHMMYKPTKEYTTAERTTRKYGETPASDRMWNLQRMIGDILGTVIPTYLASDETALTVFVREQKAHPVYATIGNLAKAVRRQISKRGMVCVAYLPVTKLECEGNDDKRRILKSKLFHACMRTLTESIHTAGKQGVEAVCSDGNVRRAYPVFCGAMLDFAEQCKYASIRKPVCPTCGVPAGERGDLTDYDKRDVDEIVKCMQEHEKDGSARFMELGLMPVEPFWSKLPFVDAGSLFPPDLLHQLYKGVFKDHLLTWSAFALGKDVLNERFKSMSPHHGLRHFKDGILKAARWTGRELKEQTRVYLPTMAGEEHPEVMACARALMEFIFLAHSSSLTGDDLERMDRCLEIFHENKHIFPEIGALGEQDQAKKKGPVRTFHGIPKIHGCQHYTYHVTEHGTPDGFNTELPERLHIRDAKVGYRASNKKEVIAQMATHIQRMEAIAKHRAHLKHKANPEADDPEAGRAEEDELEIQLVDEEDDPILGDDIIVEGVVRRLAIDEAEEGEEEGFGANKQAERVERVDEGAVVEGELEEQVDEEEEVVLERRDVGEDGTWEEVTFQIETEDGEVEIEDRPSIFHPDPEIRHAKKPTISARGTHLVEKHGTTRLLPALRSFFRREQLEFDGPAPNLNDKFDIWYRCRLLHSPPPFKPTEGPRVDVVRALPGIVDRHGCRRRPAHFDTALYIHNEEGVGLRRFRACRVRAIFELPERFHDIYSGKLVYAELFNEFRGPERTTELYTTTHTYDNSARREAQVFPLSRLRMTAHIAPHYGTATKELDLSTESDILHSCKKFLFNKYGSFFSFELMHHWENVGALE